MEQNSQNLPTKKPYEEERSTQSQISDQEFSFDILDLSLSDSQMRIVLTPTDLINEQNSSQDIGDKSRHRDFDKTHCKKCGKEFGLQRHLSQHSCKENSNLTCSECGKTCKTQYNLNQHELACITKAIRKMKNLKCSHCERECDNEYNLKTHEIACRKRKRKDQSKSEAKRSKSNSLECPHCARSFGNTHNFKVHISACKQKKEQRQFKCNKCGKICDNESNLNTHEKACRKRKDVHDHCSQTPKRNKVTHNQNGGGESSNPEENQAKFNCQRCKRDFDNKHNLTMHSKSCNVSNKDDWDSFPCPNCFKFFSKESNMRKHMDRGKCKRRFCNFCGKVIQSVNEHRRHEQICKSSGQSLHEPACSTRDSTSSFECHFCEESFNSVSELKKHSKLCRWKTGKSNVHYRCRTCDETFEDRRALFVHHNTQHGTGDDDLLPVPWTSDREAPWVQNGEINEPLRLAYEANRHLIRAPSQVNSHPRIYNMPVTNDVDAADIANFLHDIVDIENANFRVNINFGYILYHRETERYRYFRPNHRGGLLDSPFRIYDHNDVEILKKNIEAKDIIQFLLNERDDTKSILRLITNLQIIVYPLDGFVGSGKLPEELKENKNIVALDCKQNGKPYADNLCIFRCLAYHDDKREFKEIKVKDLHKQWAEYSHQSNEPDKFRGITFEEIPDVEACFNVNINVYCLEDKDTAVSVYKSLLQFEKTVNLNLYESHFSYISNIQSFCKTYKCGKCGFFSNRPNNLLRHQRTCTGKTKFRYPGGYYKTAMDIFDEAESLGIFVPEKDRFYPWVATYDFEALLKKLPSTDTNLKFVNRHDVISVAMASNVPEYEDPHCIVDPNTDELLEGMVEYLQCIQDKAEKLSKEKWDFVFSSVDSQLTYWSEQSENGVPDQTISHMTEALQSFKGKFTSFCKVLPVVGFNSAKYDLNLIKGKLAKHLNLTEASCFTIKKNNAYSCISTDNFKLLDIASYLPPGTSYAKFLSAFQIEEQKSFFPYEYLDDVEKLNEPRLPPLGGAWYSDLKGKSVLDDGIASPEENYKNLEKVWREKGMTSLRDFLSYYNCLDVGPFIQAVEKMLQFYRQKGIQMFKSSISVPGIARNMLFSSAKKAKATFSLPNEKEKDLYNTYKSNLVGGPSIIFHRYHAKGETYIRNNKDYPCEKICGWDCNSLYLWALSQDMPTGMHIRRSAEENFKPQVSEKYTAMFDYMDFLNFRGAKIQHKLNTGKEKRFGPYFVDGWEPSDTGKGRVIEFNGCYFHGHSCYMTKNVKDKKLLQQRLERTKVRKKFFESMGIEIHDIWECEYREKLKTDRILKAFVNARKPKFYQKFPRPVSEKEILDSVKEGDLFGAVKVDIKVPDSDYDRWAEFSPLFCSIEVPFDVIGSTMQKHWEKTQQLPNSNPKKFPAKRLLVGGMKGEKLLLSTSLLKWYLEHGLEVTKVHEVIEYLPMKCFETFTTEVSNARRGGDIDSSKLVIGDTMKLLGNSAYGGIIMDRTRHTSIKYVKGKVDLARAVNDPQFKHYTDLGDDFYEVEKGKKCITLDLPIQLGFQVLQLAKLKMLEFFYDFLSVFVPKECYQLTEVDTDSFYVALSKPNLRDVIKPELVAEYDRMITKQCTDIVDFSKMWFPRSCCQKHSKFDKRVPGLFKVEYTGEKMISLCSKSYIVTNGDDFKMSTKGVNKNRIENPYEKFKMALELETTVSVQNKGFRPFQNSVYTYSQNKIGFNFFYVKRQVLEDKVSTKPLDIILSPCMIKRCEVCSEFTTYFITCEGGMSFCFSCSKFMESVLD